MLRGALCFWVVLAILPIEVGAGDSAVIRIGHNVDVIDLPLAAARKGGFFSKLGLEVEGVGRVPTHDLLLKGEVDCTVAANADRVLLLAQKGFAVKIIATIIDRHIQALVARQDFPSERASAELRGSVVAFISITGGASVTAYHKVLERFKLESSSITPVQLDPRSMIAAIQQKRALAGVINSPHLHFARQSGLKPLLDFSQDPYPFVVVACRKDFLDRDPSIALKLLQGLQGAMSRIGQDKQFALEVLRSNFNISGEKDREAVYESLVGALSPDLSPRFIELAKRESTLNVDPFSLVDTRYVEGMRRR